MDRKVYSQMLIHIDIFQVSSIQDIILEDILMESLASEDARVRHAAAAATIK